TRTATAKSRRTRCARNGRKAETARVVRRVVMDKAGLRAAKDNARNIRHRTTDLHPTKAHSGGGHASVRPFLFIPLVAAKEMNHKEGDVAASNNLPVARADYSAGVFAGAACGVCGVR